MNTFDRRQIIREQMIDAVVVKASLNKSRRQRAEVTLKLRKAMIADRNARLPKENISLPSH